MNKTQSDRVNKGLCPACGDEAAPYHLCARCRHKNLIRRVMNKAEKYNDIKSIKRGGTKYYSRTNSDLESIAWDYREALPGDGRLKPRLGKIPVNVEKELVDIFIRAGEPLTMEEINAAWGKLRVRRGRESAATDMATIIRSNRKRAEKLRRRAEKEST